MKRINSLLQVEYREDVCWLTVNRAEDRNSINTALMEELDRALTEAEAVPVRAAVITGAGDTYFIGGADGVEMMQCDPDRAAAFSRRIQDLFNRLEASPLVLVAAINGLCFGGGYELALACDFRIAGDRVHIGLPEVKVGLIPGGGGTQRLPRLVGMGRALEIILSGRLYPAQEALELNLVHALVPAERLLEETAGFLKPILKNPAYALAQAKRAVRASQGAPLAEGLRVETGEFRKCFDHSYFVQLMCRQIKTGVLSTTALLPEGFCEEKG
ncbi:MAG: enoyl-CoA hydratase/isomerase family protein [Deltaproteobacteria bacterium]|nr:enoyl-CoA hydratase/isomerase family protein [Deltaproteobacteria bacterium]